MKENKLTDKEIIKALECCSSPKANCEDCPCFNKDCISTTPYVLDLINRQQAEIERLNKQNFSIIEHLKKARKQLKTAKSEAIKEFAERLKDKASCVRVNSLDYAWQISQADIDNLVKEMVGEQG